MPANNMYYLLFVVKTCTFFVDCFATVKVFIVKFLHVNAMKACKN